MVLKKHSILVADDEPRNIEIYFNALDNNSYQVLIAPNGQVCYDIAVQTNPSLIIMDWEMPVMNGIEAVKKLGQNELRILLTL